MPQLAVEWELHFPNGTKTRLKERQYSEKQVTAQYYADSIRANVPGKYVCSFTFLKTGEKCFRKFSLSPL